MSKEILIQHLKTEIGELTVGVFEERICLCDWRYRKKRKEIDKRIQDGLQAIFVERKSNIHSELELQIKEYIKGERNTFTLPIGFVGSPFQVSVWKALLNIPYGITKSYLDLSKELGNPKAIRAVASANGANAISIIVPCHRIIGSNGELTGYAGGLKAKQRLLEIENALLPKEQLSLF